MRQSSVITLLTDFGDQDAYAGIMKGVIAGINPHATIVDICHSIPPQDIFYGAYLLYTSYKYFPKGTIHVAVVDPSVGSERDIVCTEIHDYLFLTPNNGLLSFIVHEEQPKAIIHVTNNKYFLPSPSNTFHGRDIFAPVAAYLSLGVKPQQLGIKTNHLEQLDIPKPHYKKTGQLEGQIIYIDRFGNLITNITREHLAQCSHNRFTPPIPPLSKGGMKGGYGRKLSNFHSSQDGVAIARKDMETTVGKKKIVGLCNTYAAVKTGEPLALFGSTGFLEVSINQGNAQKYFKVDKGSKVIIKCNPGTIR